MDSSAVVLAWGGAKTCGTFLWDPPPSKAQTLGKPGASDSSAREPGGSKGGGVGRGSRGGRPGVGKGRSEAARSMGVDLRLWPGRQA